MRPPSPFGPSATVRPTASRSPGRHAGPRGRAPVRPARSAVPPRPAGSRKSRAHRSRFWRYRRVLFLFGLLLFTALAGATWVITQIPVPNEAPLAYTTVIYDARGNPLAELHGNENRFPVTIDQVPQVMQDAVIAAEDRNFLTHRGVDPVGILRATWADIRAGEAAQGGSTITQQYVKNAVVGSDRTLARKLKEAVVAIKLERQYDKRTILEKYLNAVYFGRGAYGVQAAARAYYDKDAADLDLRESAYLAGLIRSPSAGDVYSNPAEAVFLRSTVLKAMVDARFINPEQAAEVEAVPIESYTFVPSPADTTVTNLGVPGVEHFVAYVHRQLVEAYGEDRVLAGGLRVQTSLDPEVQAMAYQAVYGTLDRAEDPDGALVALDRDGRVVAMVGGRDWNESQVNLAVGLDGGGGGRQCGSACKPFVLAEALRQGWKLSDRLPGPAEATFPRADAGKDWEVANYEDAAFGTPTLMEATAFSVNTVYARLALEVGPARVAQLARDLGIRTEVAPLPSIALGTQEVSVLDLTNAYLTLANNGLRVDPRVITSVRDQSATLLEDKPRGATQVLEPEVAAGVRNALAQVVANGSGTQAQLPGGSWGKTGTTENYGDAWFVGANDTYTVGVWIGYKEGQSRPLLNVRGVRRVAGGTFPAAIFRSFMLRAAPGDGSTYRPPPIDPATFPSQSPTTVTTTAPTTTTMATPPTSTGAPPGGGSPPLTLPPAPTVPGTTPPGPVPTTPAPTSPTTVVDPPDTTRPRITLPNRP